MCGSCCSSVSATTRCCLMPPHLRCDKTSKNNCTTQRLGALPPSRHANIVSSQPVCSIVCLMCFFFAWRPSIAMKMSMFTCTRAGVCHSGLQPVVCTNRSPPQTEMSWGSWIFNTLLQCSLAATVYRAMLILGFAIFQVICVD